MIAILSLSTASLESYLYSIDAILPIIYEKKHTPNTMMSRAKIFSAAFTGSISPYPTVDIVVKAQYSESIYTAPLESS